MAVLARHPEVSTELVEVFIEACPEVYIELACPEAPTECAEVFIEGSKCPSKVVSGLLRASGYSRNSWASCLLGTRPLPPAMAFIIFCIWRNWFSS